MLFDIPNTLLRIAKHKQNNCKKSKFYMISGSKYASPCNSHVFCLLRIKIKTP